MKKILSLLFIASLSISCSSDSESETPIETPPVVITQPPVLTTQNPVYSNGILRFHGTVVFQGSGSGYYEKGFAYGNNTNPIINDNYIKTDGSGEGPFFADSYSFYEGQVINIRAYAIHENIPSYGNNIIYTIPRAFEFNTIGAFEIHSTKATFRASGVSSTGATSIYRKGFLVGTSPDLTTANALYTAYSTEALNNFTETIDNLNINTTYYVRSFGYQQANNVYYGNVSSFKTVGYRGQSGGYVFYDKGENTNGWRYLEAGPTDLTYNNSVLIKWGCTNVAISQTFREIGKGLENTNRIVSLCNDANSAARICYDYTINGLSDWFLPSKDELFALDESASGVFSLGTSTNQVHWSSNEYNGVNAHYVNTYYGMSMATGISKNIGNLVRPVRRF